MASGLCCHGLCSCQPLLVQRITLALDCTCDPFLYDSRQTLPHYTTLDAVFCTYPRSWLIFSGFRPPCSAQVTLLDHIRYVACFK